MLWLLMLIIDPREKVIQPYRWNMIDSVMIKQWKNIFWSLFWPIVKKSLGAQVMFIYNPCMHTRCSWTLLWSANSSFTLVLEYCLLVLGLSYSYTKASDTTLNSSPPSAAYMHQLIGSSLVQIMVCRLFGTKPLSKPMLGYCQLDPP